MIATKLNNFVAKKHFGVINKGRQVELMLTTNDELLQIIDGSYSGQKPAPGKTAEEAYDMIRQSIVDAIDFS